MAAAAKAKAEAIINENPVGTDIYMSFFFFFLLFLLPSNTRYFISMLAPVGPLLYSVCHHQTLPC